MRTRVFLSPSQPQLVGKYPGKAEHIHVVCNATRSFTTALPDLNACEQMEFIIYNLASSAGTVTVTGKLMSTGATSRVLNPGDIVTFVSDLKTTWLLDSPEAGTVPGSNDTLKIMSPDAGATVWIYQLIGGTWIQKDQLH